MSSSASNEITDHFDIHPNPTSDRLFISDIRQDDKLIITDKHGITVKKIDANQLKHQFVMVDDLLSGVYLLTIKRNSGLYTLRFVKI
jgi:hypothetical protein